MKSVYVYSYNSGSRGAQELADALQINRIRHNRSGFLGRSSKTVINWGSTEVPPEVKKCCILNPPELVRYASNKLSFFKKVSDKCRTVPWTTSKSEAEKWIADKGVVVQRTILSGHSGHGIVIAENVNQLIKAPLYTLYVPKQSEYRIHIMKGEVIDIQRKIRDPDREPSDWKVRSHDNGFIYVRTGFVCPPEVIKQSLAAVLASGLDFGATDCIFNSKRNEGYILEINTAPGLEGTTVTNYANAFKKILK